ncbi:hypothetical protein ABT158_33140 [Nonomuraea sp. NPDC001636]|uniref:hypothetical protein n=1 Tax=Nonomuraea sp. NPDC001636 TaxID=3154391 RepID=UPI00331A742E
MSSTTEVITIDGITQIRSPRSTSATARSTATPPKASATAPIPASNAAAPPATATVVPAGIPADGRTLVRSSASAGTGCCSPSRASASSTVGLPGGSLSSSRAARCRAAGR